MLGRGSGFYFCEVVAERVLTFSPSTKIFDPKIETYQRIDVDMIPSRPFQVPKWNRPFSCPR